MNSTPSKTPSPSEASPQPSFVKLAMRNIVRKGGKSFQHFVLTAMGLLAILIGLSFLTR